MRNNWRMTRYAGRIRLLPWLLLALSSGAAADQSTIRLGVPPWQGAEAKSAVVSEILQATGFDVETVSAAAVLIFHGLARGELDVNLSAWVPGQEEAFGPRVELGEIVILGENLRGARTGLAVPASVYRSGLESVADLDRFAAELDSTIYCIEPGSGANTVAEAAIRDDLYGLGEWRVLPSSTQAMLTHVGRAIRRDHPTVFCAWAPHWMNEAFDLHYLHDPAGHLGGPGDTQVLTLARRGLPEDAPNVTEFFRRFQVDAEVQSQWVYAYAQEERPLEQMAREWIRANLEIVTPWLAGLQTSTGADAVEALEDVAAAWSEESGQRGQGRR